MASRVSRTARARTKAAARDLESVVKEMAESARAVAKRHGVKRSVTIVKGRTTSNDAPRKIKIIKE